MSKALGALVFCAGIAGLTFWGAKGRAVSLEKEIAIAAEAVAAQALHPLKIRVSGRDITVAGIADTEDELAAITRALDGVRGRRVVDADGIAVLPRVAPYETALAKGAAGGVVAQGFVPSEAARAVLLEAGLPAAGFGLASGAPEGWAEAMRAGVAALAPLETGSFAVTGETLTLEGIATSPAEAEAARVALNVPGGFQTVVAVDVADPGMVDFTLAYDAATGYRLDGVVPEGFGPDEFSAALGADVASGTLATAYADLPGLDPALSGLAAVLPQVETLEIIGGNTGIAVRAQARAGLAPEHVTAALAKAFGPGARVEVSPATELPKDGTGRHASVPGGRRFVSTGGWAILPEGLDDPTPEICTRAAMDRVAAAPIRFVSASAELDPVSMAVIDDLAAIVSACTRGPGMIVTIGGHAVATGGPEATYILSARRARAVREALAARGVPVGRMIAIGYGEIGPVADSETEAGRAPTLPITFAWPG